MIRNISLLLSSSFFLLSCGTKTEKATKTASIYKQVSPTFDADSAYTYVSAQVAFGPRTPNSPAHEACGNYLTSELTRFGAKVTEQRTVVIGYDKSKLDCRNIIGSYSPEKKDRILLFAHWDTRPWADQDPNPQNKHTPILGANDAGSGVGVLLEVARQLQKRAPNLGIDIAFFDVEDYGVPVFDQKAEAADPKELSWCLGSRYWSLNPHTPGYNARFGILLDMVGGKNVTFLKEYNSTQSANDVVGKIWGLASQLGYSANFVNKEGGAIIDDHIPVIQNLQIPCVDLIAYDQKTGSFPAYWHTLNDNMSSVDKQALKAVGQTILEVIYTEK